jgi:hypothetical protein
MLNHAHIARSTLKPSSMPSSTALLGPLKEQLISLWWTQSNTQRTSGTISPLFLLSHNTFNKQRLDFLLYKYFPCLTFHPQLRLISYPAYLHIFLRFSKINLSSFRCGYVNRYLSCWFFLRLEWFFRVINLFTVD